MQVTKIAAAGEAEITSVADVRARIEAAMPILAEEALASEELAS